MANGERPEVRLTFVVGFDLLLELFHFHVALALVLAPLERQRSKVAGLVLRFLLLVLADQRVLVVVGDSCEAKDVRL